MSSDYRLKCVNATRDILMSKARKITVLTITMFIQAEEQLERAAMGEEEEGDGGVE